MVIIRKALGVLTVRLQDTQLTIGIIRRTKLGITNTEHRTVLKTRHVKTKHSMRHAKTKLSMRHAKTKHSMRHAKNTNTASYGGQGGGICMNGLFQEYIFANLYILFIASRSPGWRIKIAIVLILIIIPRKDNFIVFDINPTVFK